jgi:hypothetical protein
MVFPRKSDLLPWWSLMKPNERRRVTRDRGPASDSDRLLPVECAYSADRTLTGGPSRGDLHLLSSVDRRAGIGAGAGTRTRKPCGGGF